MSVPNVADVSPLDVSEESWIWWRNDFTNRQDGFRCLAAVEFEEALTPIWVDVTWSDEIAVGWGLGPIKSPGMWIETAGGNAIEHPIKAFAPLPELIDV